MLSFPLRNACWHLQRRDWDGGNRSIFVLQQFTPTSPAIASLSALIAAKRTPTIPTSKWYGTGCRWMRGDRHFFYHVVIILRSLSLLCESPWRQYTWHSISAF